MVYSNGDSGYSGKIDADDTGDNVTSLLTLPLLLRRRRKH
jgi:hypothetical protein